MTYKIKFTYINRLINLLQVETRALRAVFTDFCSKILGSNFVKLLEIARKLLEIARIIKERSKIQRALNINAIFKNKCNYYM